MADVYVKSPYGDVVSIPEENAQAALKDGATQLTQEEFISFMKRPETLPLKNPAGEVVEVPTDNYAEALQDGGAELSDEEASKFFAKKVNEDNPISSAMASFGSRFWQNVKNTIDLGKGVAKTVIEDPVGTLEAAMDNKSSSVIPGAGAVDAIGNVIKKSEANINSVGDEPLIPSGIPGSSLVNDTYKQHMDEMTTETAREAQVQHPIAATMGDLTHDVGLTVMHPIVGLPALVTDPIEQEKRDSWLENREISAENIKTNMALSVATGGLGLTSAPALKNSLDDFAIDAAKAEKDVARGILHQIDDEAAAKAANVADVKITPDVSSLAEAEKAASTGAKKYIVKNADNLRSSATDEVAESIKSIRKEIDTHGNRSLNEDELMANIPERRTGYVSQQSSAGNIKEYLRRTAQELAESEPKLAKKLSAHADEMEKSSKPTSWFSSAAKASDDLEQAVTRLAKNPDSPTLKYVQDAQGNVRRELTREPIWGNAAEAEVKRFNNYHSSYGPATSQLDDAFFNSKGNLVTDKIEKAIKSGNAKVVDQYLSAARSVADRISVFDPKAGAALTAKIDSAATGLNKVKFYTNIEQGYGSTLAAKKELRNQAVEFVKGLPVVSNVVQAVNTAKAGLKVASNVAKASGEKGVYETLDSIVESSRKRWSDAVRNSLRDTVNAPLPGRNPIKETSGGLGTYAAGQVFYDWSKDPSTYKSDTQTVQTLAKNPDQLADNVAKSFGGLTAEYPEVYADIAKQQFKAVMFLASKVPQVPRQGIAASRNYTPSEDSIWEYSLYYSAVMDPDSVADSLASGTAKVQQIEALQVVYPQKYAELKQMVLEELKRLDDAGLPVSINGRATTDLLFNTDGAGDPALSWDVALNIVGARQAAAQQQKTSINPTSVSQSPTAQSSKPQGIN